LVKESSKDGSLQLPREDKDTLGENDKEKEQQ